MKPAGDLQRAIASLRREAEALTELRQRCARLRDAAARSYAELDAVTEAIDRRIDACLRIGALVARGAAGEPGAAAVGALEAQLRRLGTLRSRVLALYVSADGARGGG
jgi:hypothetical protein